MQTIAGAAEMMARKLRNARPTARCSDIAERHYSSRLKVMADSDFRGMMEKVVIAARDRSIELGK